MSDVEQIGEEENVHIDHCDKTPVRGDSITKGYDILSVALKVIFSTPGLVVLVILYSIMGAFIFPLLESPREIKNMAAIAKSREECLRELWTITEKLNVLYEKNWTMLVHEQLRRFEGSIVAATRNGLNGLETDRTTRWSFSEALLYSVTVITTIGHGNLTPKTSEGKIVTILYALFGVPLMLMCLSSLGGLLAEALQCTYMKFCCSQRRSKRKNSNNSCLGQSNEMDCNVCKYDAVNSSDTKLHNYDYIPMNEREDSCNLIQNSPMKINHNSPCMQLRTYTSAPLRQQQYIIKAAAANLSPIKSHNQENSPQHYPLGSMTGNNSNYYRNSNDSSSNNYAPTNCGPTAGIIKGVGGGGGAVAAGGLLCHTNPCLEPTLATTTTAPTGSEGSTTTATVYFPMGANFTCNSTIHFNQSPVKYQGFQVQHQLGPTHNKACDTHAHTATVHGIRRGKFIPKPMPPEINMLLAEGDIPYRQNAQNPNELQSKALMVGSAGSIDIMEDEEENEQNRAVGSCPHGTPSRIPLIASSSRTSSCTKRNGYETELDQEVILHDNPVDSGKYRNHDIERNTAGTAAAGDDKDGKMIINCEKNINNGSNTGNGSLPQVPITIVLLILISYILLGTVIFAFWEDWSLIDGAYFCFVTLSTIGYGDFLPKQTFRSGPDVQLFACCAYLLLGLVLVAMAFSILETQLMWKCKRIAVRLKLAKD